MQLFEITNDKIKFLNCTIFKRKIKKQYIKLYCLGVLIYQYKNLIMEILHEFHLSKSYDVTTFDRKIQNMVSLWNHKKNEIIDRKKIAFLATACYDVGGHSKWLRDMMKTLKNNYQEKLFLVSGKNSEIYAQKTLSEIKSFAEIEFFKKIYLSKKKEIINIYEKIINFKPKTLFLFIHPDDVISTAVLALIKQNTNIRLIYVNHATHLPCLGMSFSDLIVEEVNSTAYITQKMRKLPQTYIAGLISKSQEENPDFSIKEIDSMKKNMGIQKGYLCTMSGASSYKFFDGQKSEYFEMIYQMLKRNKQIHHTVISSFDMNELEIIDNIFNGKKEKERLTLLPFQQNYELAFKCADLFIDSFPMSSALTFIDLMRLKVPYVVKINKENAALSFHEYQHPEFMYMYENTDDMLKGIELLLSDSQKRKEITEKNYDFYLSKYEPRAALKILSQIIETNNLSDMYSKLDEARKYSFRQS